MIPTKNEFGTDPRAYNDTFRDPRVQSSQITAEELTVALQLRLIIVLVCKHWRDIGLPILYSHFRIPAKLDDPAYQTIHQTLAGDSRLTNSVRRLTVDVDEDFVKSNDEEEAEKLIETNRGVASILSLLSRLKIVLASPMLFWLMPLSVRSSVEVAEFTVLEVNYPNKTSRIDGWEHLVHLALDFSASETHEYHEDALTLSFPSLIFLDISTGLETHEGLITSISNKWHAPKLDTFCCCEWTAWLPFLARHAPTLTTLDLRDFPDITNPSPVHLPNLRQLFLEGNSIQYDPRTLVDAPHLERVFMNPPRENPGTGFAGLMWATLQLVFIDRVLTLWRNAEPVRTYCLLVEDTVFPRILSEPSLMEGVNALRSRGSEVVFYPDDGGFQVFEPLNV